MKREWWRLLLTEADNFTPSVFRALALSLCVHLAVLASWQVFVLNLALDFTSYGTAVSVILAAAGIGERLAGTHSPGEQALAPQEALDGERDG